MAVCHWSSAMINHTVPAWLGRSRDCSVALRPLQRLLPYWYYYSCCHSPIGLPEFTFSFFSLPFPILLLPSSCLSFTVSLSLSLFYSSLYLPSPLPSSSSLLLSRAFSHSFWCCGSSVMASVNGSFVSPTADATILPQVFQPTGLVASLLQGFSVWKALLTLFLGAVVYDQCEYHNICFFSSIYRFKKKLEIYTCTFFSPLAAGAFVCIGDGIMILTFVPSSAILLPQRLHRRPSMEDSFHGSVPRIGQPQVPRIQGEMG